MAEKKYLQLSPEHQARAEARARQQESSPKIMDEHLAIAEFGMFYGYEGVRAVLSDEVDSDTFSWLLEAARRVDARNQYNSASASFTAAAAIASKKPSQDFKRYTDHYLKKAKADI